MSDPAAVQQEFPLGQTRSRGIRSFYVVGYCVDLGGIDMVLLEESQDGKPPPPPLVDVRLGIAERSIFHPLAVPVGIARGYKVGTIDGPGLPAGVLPPRSVLA